MNKSNCFIFDLLLLALLMTTACKKNANEMSNDLLQGNWTVQSWTLNGVEQMQTKITTFTMEYQQQLAPHKGQVSWVMDAIMGRDPDFTGIYDIQDDGAEIIIEGDYFDLEVTEQELRLARFFDGIRWDIMAKRED